jgi:hypothetical protein
VIDWHVVGHDTISGAGMIHWHPDVVEEGRARSRMAIILTHR